MTLRLTAAAFAMATLAGCTTGYAQDMMETPSPMPPLEAQIIGDTGDVVGIVTMTQGLNGVLGSVSLNADAVSPGWHGLHIHQVGDCSDVGTFTNSGGHLGKIEGGHGLLNPDGPEMGDLPNLYAHSDGSASMEFFSDLFTLADIRDEDGAALIMHQNRDDHITQPIGGAGPRVGCAVLK